MGSKKFKNKNYDDYDDYDELKFHSKKREKKKDEIFANDDFFIFVAEKEKYNQKRKNKEKDKIKKMNKKNKFID